ncbi:hypothetical protein VTK73DRAFT_4287 [Phialemonium thermophilum]|uniref:Uncharacterized protein n=1 Tax=Phialemonium thermophilum TaxID=223376 RepID=A0ABR3V9Z8_9PEZI
MGRFSFAWVALASWRPGLLDDDVECLLPWGHNAWLAECSVTGPTDPTDASWNGCRFRGRPRTNLGNGTKKIPYLTYVPPVRTCTRKYLFQSPLSPVETVYRHLLDETSTPLFFSALRCLGLYDTENKKKKKIMSSLKRKGGPGATAAAAKSTKTESESRPTKRSKATTTTKKKPETAKTGAAAAPQKDGPAVVSRLKEEEPLFPRGGGSVLSPLEQKQIQIQAKNDVLFEQASGGGASSRKRDGAAPTKKKRRASEKEGKAARQAAAAAAAHDEEAVKIESLNYKRLVRGSLVLGQVCADLARRRRGGR